MFTGLIQRCDLGGDGPTVVVKDTIDIAGLPTRAGSRARAAATPASVHAAAVTALHAAGWRVIGKSVTHELAFGVTGVNAWAGTPVNPRFPHLIPGGSSSGSASMVAAGEVAAAIGTDTGGSIRMPAACCGVFGLKPTFGRIDRRGAMPADTSLDCLGPLAAGMDHLIAVMSALEPGFTAHLPSRAGSLRLGVVDVPSAPIVAQAVQAAVQNLDRAGIISPTPVALPGMEEAFQAALTVINAETWAACGHYLATGLVGDDVAARLRRAADTSAADLTAAEVVRARFTAAVDHALEGVDALLLPTLPDFPQRLEDAMAGHMDLRATALLRPFNLSGHPALTLPLPAVNDAPVALQIIGRRGDDELVCGIGRHLAPVITARHA